MPARVLERLTRGRHREDDEVIDLALIFRLHPFVGMERVVRTVAALDLAGDLAGKIGDVEFFDSGRAALALEDLVPRRLDAGAKRRNHSEARAHDAAHSLTSGRGDRAARISKVVQV